MTREEIVEVMAVPILEAGLWKGTYAAFNQHDTNGDNVLSGNEVWDGGYRRNPRNRPDDSTGAFDELDEAGWTAALDSTLHSALRLIRAGLPHLRASERPAILVILSSSAREPIPGYARRLAAEGTIGEADLGVLQREAEAMVEAEARRVVVGPRAALEQVFGPGKLGAGVDTQRLGLVKIGRAHV